MANSVFPVFDTTNRCWIPAHFLIAQQDKFLADLEVFEKEKLGNDLHLLSMTTNTTSLKSDKTDKSAKTDKSETDEMTSSVTCDVDLGNKVKDVFNDTTSDT